jgi:hypothetical protein
MTTTKFDCRTGRLPAAIEARAGGATGLQPLKYMDFLAVSYYDMSWGEKGDVTITSRLLLALVLLLFIGPTIPTCSATVVTFDNLSDSTTGTFIPTGYQGLSWSNFAYLNAVLHSNVFGVSGANYGMVSPFNVAFNGSGFPAEIDSRGTNFNFLSAYFTGAWNSNLNIEIQGFRSGTLLYDTTVVASATSPTLFTFNDLDIDRLYFNSFGGQDAGFGSGAGEVFVMDNFTFEFIPEPSTLLLTAMGSVSLMALLRRRRHL